METVEYCFESTVSKRVISGDFIFTNFGSLKQSQYQKNLTNLWENRLSSLISEDFGLSPY